MPTNLELKIKLKTFSKTEKLLQKAGAQYKGILNQKDIYYEFKKGLLKLRIEKGENYLIKYLRDEKGKRWSNYEILKIDGKNVEKYLAEFWKVEAVVEKKRKLYLIGDTRIHLDEVKRLGKFLELETVVIKDKQAADKQFKNVVEILQLDTNNQIKTSYRNLISK